MRASLDLILVTQTHAHILHMWPERFARGLFFHRQLVSPTPTECMRFDANKFTAPRLARPLEVFTCRSATCSMKCNLERSYEFRKLANTRKTSMRAPDKGARGTSGCHKGRESGRSPWLFPVYSGHRENTKKKEEERNQL